MTQMVESIESPAAGDTTLDQRRRDVRERFRHLGLTIGQWADANGYNRRTVYSVINGRLAGHYGLAHDIAVKLGLKDGELRDEAGLDA